MDRASPKEDGRIPGAGVDKAASDLDLSEMVDPRVSLNSAKSAIQNTLLSMEGQYRSLKFLPPQEPSNFMAKMVAGWKFRWAVFSVIFLNMAVISLVEGIWDHEQVAAVTLTVERLALVFYTAEWLLRLYAGQLCSRRCCWTQF